MTDPREITLALRGRWHGRYGLALCPAHDNSRTPALSIGAGRDGRLLLSCKAGCSFLDVIAALRSLGLVDGDGRAPDPDPATEARRRDQEESERERKIAAARGAWDAALPLSGTLAERYLRRRAIRAERPGSLRYDPRCAMGGTRRPAMVAAITLEGEGVVGAHRTALEEPGRKAGDLANPKMMLGACRGGAVRLSKGAGPLVVAEGIETALSLLDALAAHDPAVWAALSTGGVAGLTLPEEAGELVIAPDADAPGRKATEALAKRAEREGWSVRLLPPPDGFKDWNDAAMAREVAHG